MIKGERRKSRDFVIEVFLDRIRSLFGRKSQGFQLAVLALMKIRFYMADKSNRTRGDILRKISKLNSVLTRFSDKSLAEPSISVRRAYFRWLVKANSSIAKECLEKMVLSVTIKKEISVWRLMKLRDSEFIRRKAKFLEFVEKLVDLTSRANSKMVHSYKNLFFFSLLLISARKEKEDFNRKLFTFVKTVNTKMSQKTSSVVSHIVNKNPKQTLLSMLLKGTQRKEQESLNRMQMLAKKGRLLVTYKFVDLFTAKMASKTKSHFDLAVPFRKNFISATINKLKLSLKRLFKQLINRSLFLKNQKEGLDKFINILEQALKKSAKRDAFGSIKSVYDQKLKAKKLHQQLEIIYKCQNKRKLKETLRILSEKTRMIKQQLKIMAIKKLTKAAKVKGSEVLRRLGKFANKSLSLRILLLNRMLASSKEKLFKVVSMLRTLNISVSCTTEKEKLKARKLLAFYALNNSKRAKFRQSLYSLKQHSSQLLIKLLRLTNLINKKSRQDVHEIFKFLKSYVDLKRIKDQQNRNAVGSITRKLKTIEGEILRNSFMQLKGFANTFKAGLASLHRLFIQKEDRDKYQSLLSLKFNIHKRRVVVLKQESLNALREHAMKVLNHSNKFAKRQVIQRLKMYKNNKKRAEIFLLNTIKRRSLHGLKNAFDTLKRNNFFSIIITDQEKRKLTVVRMLQTLSKIENKKKSIVFRLLQNQYQKAVFGGHFIKKLAEKKYRFLTSNAFSKLVGHYRKNKLFEFTTILDKTTTDLSDFNKVFRPKYNQTLVKNLLKGKLLHSYSALLSNTIKKLKAFCDMRFQTTNRISKFALSKSLEVKRKCLQNLRENSRKKGNRIFELNMIAWKLEKIISTSNRLNVYQSFQAVYQGAKLRKVNMEKLEKILKIQNNCGLMSAFHILRINNAVLKTGDQHISTSKRSVFFSHTLQSLFENKKLESKKNSFQILFKISNNQIKLKKIMMTMFKKHCQFVLNNLVRFKDQSVNEAQEKANVETNKRILIDRLIKTNFSKQAHILRIIVDLLRCQKIKELKYAYWTNLYKMYKNYFLEVLESLGKWSKEEKVRKFKIEMVFSRLRNNSRFNGIQSLVKLRQFGKRKIRLQSTFFKMLKFGSKTKQIISLNEFRLLLSHVKDRSLIAQRSLMTIMNCLRFKISKIQKQFFTQMANIRQSNITAHLAESTLSKMNFRKKAGDFLARLSENQGQSKLRLKVLSKIFSNQNSKILNVLKKLIGLNNDRRQKYKSFGIAICIPMILSLKQKQIIFYKKTRYLIRQSRISKYYFDRILISGQSKMLSCFEKLKAFMTDKVSKTKNSNLVIGTMIKSRTTYKLKSSFDKLRHLLLDSREAKMKLVSCQLVWIAQRKQTSVLRVLKNPLFKKKQKMNACEKICSVSKISGQNNCRFLFSRIVKLSPLYVFKMWKRSIAIIFKIFNSRLILPFLMIQKKGITRRGLKLIRRPKILIASRSIIRFISRRNLTDEKELLYPSFLALIANALHDKLDNVHKATLYKFSNIVNGPSNSSIIDQFEQINQREELKSINLQCKESKEGLLIGNKLMIKQATALTSENERLEFERAHLSKNQQELEDMLGNYQVKLERLHKEMDKRAIDFENQKIEKETIEAERKQLENNLLYSQNMNDDSSIKDSHISYEAGQEFRSRISRLQKDKKRLEELLLKYTNETKNMEEEMNRFEKEESSFIEKIASLQNDHLTVQSQLIENEYIHKKLREENKKLANDNQSIIQDIEQLTKETKLVVDQMKALEEEGRLVAVRELALKDENSSLVRLNQNLTDENLILLNRQRLLLQEKDELIEKNKTLSIQAEDLTNQREFLTKEKDVLIEIEKDLRRQIFNRQHSMTKLEQDNQYLISQRSIQFGDQELLMNEVVNQKGSRRKSLVANERLEMINLKLKVIDDNILNNNQQINSEVSEIKKVEVELKEATSNIENAELQIKQLDERIGKVQNILSENILKVDALTDKIKQGTSKIGKNNTQIEINGKLIGENKSLIEEIEQTLKDLRSQEEEGHDTIKKKRNVISDLDFKLENNTSNLLQNQKEETKILDNHSNIQKKLQESEFKIRNFELKKDELASKIASLTNEAQNLKKQESVAKSVISEKAIQLESIAEFEGEEDEDIPLDVSNLQSRHDITRRMSELRENLENASRTLAEKKALLGQSENKYFKTQNKIDDQKNIVIQTGNKISEIQKAIGQNLKNLNDQKLLIEKNEEEIKAKDALLERNNEEIKNLNAKLKETIVQSVQQPVNFKKLIHKKIQTFVIESNENRCQTDICFFDITNLEKKAAQKHIVRTIEKPPEIKKFEKGVYTKEEVIVAPVKKETRKSMWVEESIAPIIQRVRQMQREPSMRRDFPLINPDDPMNLPYVNKDRRLEKIDKLYDFKFEPSEDLRDIIGILKKNPFMKIELNFDLEPTPKKSKIIKNVQDISGYFNKFNDKSAKPDKDFTEINNHSELDMLDLSCKIPTGSLELHFVDRPRIETIMATGPSFYRPKSTQTCSDLQDVFEFLFPKSESKKLDPLPSIREVVRIDNKIKEVQTNATQTEFEPIYILVITKISNIFKLRDQQSIHQAFNQICSAGMKVPNQKANFEVASRKIFNNKRIQIQFQMKAMREKKVNNARKFDQVLGSFFRRYLNENFNQLKLIVSLDTCKLYLNSLFRWKLQNVQFNHQKQLNHIKSLRMGLDSIFTHLIYKRLGQAFRQIQRHQDMKMKNVYAKLLPIIFKGDQAYKTSMRNVLHYWNNVKDENRWFTQVIREMILKTSLEPQIALWKLKFYRKTQKIIPPKVFAGVTRICKFFKSKNERFAKEFETELRKFIIIPSSENEDSIPDFKEGTFDDGHFNGSQTDENLSRVNAKYLVLSVKTIFRTIEDRWKIRKCAAFIQLKNSKNSRQTVFVEKNNRYGQASPNIVEKNTEFLLEQNFKCKQEIDKKDSAIVELNKTIVASKRDLMFLKNNFLYVFLNRIQYVINKQRTDDLTTHMRHFMNELKKQGE
jgi:hypothetical protein